QRTATTTRREPGCRTAEDRTGLLSAGFLRVLGGLRTARPRTARLRTGRRRTGRLRVRRAGAWAAQHAYRAGQPVDGTGAGGLVITTQCKRHEVRHPQGDDYGEDKTCSHTT